MSTPDQPPSPAVPDGYPVPPPTDGPPAPAPPGSDPRTNGFAITSLVLGFTGPVLSILLGSVFGILALRRIKRYGQRGRRLAIAGLALSGVWAAAAAVVIPLAIASEVDRDASGQITEGGDVPVEDLAVGDCITGTREAGSEATRLPAVPCTEPHESEVFAIFDLPPGAWPGEDGVLEQADAACYERLGSYSADAAADPSVYYTYLYPTSAAWAMGDREVICLTYYIDGQRTGSVRG